MVAVVPRMGNTENAPGASQHNRTVECVCHFHAELRYRSVPSRSRECTRNAEKPDRIRQHSLLEIDRERRARATLYIATVDWS
jgi:hypothetical protein